MVVAQRLSSTESKTIGHQRGSLLIQKECLKERKKISNNLHIFPINQCCFSEEKNSKIFVRPAIFYFRVTFELAEIFLNLKP